MSASPPDSQSRSRSREPIHAAGRGGFGNIHAGGPSEKVIEEQDESERAAHLHPPGLYVFFSFSKCGAPNTEFYCVISLGTPSAGVALQTLALARYRTPKAPVTPTAPITLIRRMSTTPSPSVVVAEEISPVIIRASLDRGIRTTPRQGLCKACLPVVEFMEGEHRNRHDDGHEYFNFYASTLVVKC
jgi:hypothetical protein